MCKNKYALIIVISLLISISLAATPTFSNNLPAVQNSLEISKHPIILNNIEKKDIFSISPDAPLGFDSSTMHIGSATLRDVVVGSKLKGPSDDTVRIFSVQSAAPRQALLCTDTGSTSMKWRTDTLQTASVGFAGAAIGDVDRDGTNEIIYGKFSTPYHLHRARWSGTNWIIDTLGPSPGVYFTFSTGPIYDVAIGDANNDGYADDIIATLGTGGAMHLRWTGTAWDTFRIVIGDAAACYGVAVGDFNPNFPGNEVALVTYYGTLAEARWNNATNSWSVVPILSNTVVGFYDVVIGDIDPDSPGNELVALNYKNFATYGNIFIFYSVGSSWSLLQLLGYIGGWSTLGEFAIGNVFDANNGNELVAVQGGSSSGTPFIVYKNFGNWYLLGLPGTGGTNYGVAVGNINRHRVGTYITEHEIAISGNNRIWEYQQRAMFNNDVTVSNITFTPSIIFVGDSVRVTISITNTGYNTQTSIPVSYTDGTIMVNETWTGSIIYGQTINYTFNTKYIPTSVGSVTIKGYTGLVGDQYPQDDTMIKQFSVVNPAINTFPYFQNFEGTVEPEWVSGIYAGTANDWVLGTPAKTNITGPFSGSNCWVTNLTANYSLSQNSFVMTPVFDFSSLTNPVVLSVWHNFYTEDGWDAGIIEYTTDGINWVKLDTASGLAINWYNSTSTSGPIPPMKWSGNTRTVFPSHINGWVKSSRVLNMLVGQSRVRFRFRFGSDPSVAYEGWAFDDFQIEIFRDVSVEEIIRPQLVEPMAFMPEVMVKNNGDVTENIPVVAEIWTQSIGLNEGFEGTVFPPEGWVVYNNDGGTQTWIRNTTNPHSGSAAASCRYETSTLRNDDWLVTPQINVPTGAALSFWYRTSTAADDTMEIYLSTTGNAISNFTTLLDAFGIRTTSWAQKTIDLSAYAGQQIYIAFVNKGLYQWTVFLDDIEIAYTPPSLIYADTTTVYNVLPNSPALPVSFDMWTPVVLGSYTFKAYTILDGDLVPTNNQKTRIFTYDHYDVGVRSIVEPVGTVYLGNPVYPTVWVKNYDITTPNVFNVTLKIGDVYTNTKSVSNLAPNDSTLVIFDVWMPVLGTYSIIAYTSKEYDINPSNDTVLSEIIVSEPINNVGAIAILMPTDTVNANMLIAPRARVKNFGGVSETFTARFKIGDIYNETVLVENLAPNAVREITFPQWLTIAGSYTVSCSTELESDQNHNDDKVSSQTIVRLIDVLINEVTVPQDTIITDYSYQPTVVIFNNSAYTNTVALCSVLVRIVYYPAELVGYCSIRPNSEGIVEYEEWLVSELNVGETDTLYFPSYHTLHWDIYWHGEPITHQLIVEVKTANDCDLSNNLVDRPLIVRAHNRDLAMIGTALIDGEQIARRDTLEIKTYNVMSVIVNSDFGPLLPYRARVKITKLDDNLLVYSRYLDRWLNASSYDCLVFPTGWMPVQAGWYKIESWLETRPFDDVITENNYAEHAYYFVDLLPCSHSSQIVQSSQNVNATLPSTFILDANIPNPFNQRTIIQWQMPKATKVSITVYDVNGRVVKNLINSYLEGGIHQIIWDGTNNNNEKVDAGIYFYEMKADKFNSRRKMIITQ